MTKYQKRKDEIIKLRDAGKSYNEICKILNCSKGVVSYHCGPGQKTKHKERMRSRLKVHPFLKKLDTFKDSTQNNHQERIVETKWKRILMKKINNFMMNYEDRKQGTRSVMSKNRTAFTVQDVIDKAGDNPKCYLTGRPIDIYSPRTYHFDHIIPVSRGGDCSLENLGICCKEANKAKSDMTLDEFYTLCKEVVSHIPKN